MQTIVVALFITIDQIWFLWSMVNQHRVLMIDMPWLKRQILAILCDSNTKIHCKLTINSHHDVWANWLLELSSDVWFVPHKAFILIWRLPYNDYHLITVWSGPWYDNWNDCLPSSNLVPTVRIMMSMMLL